jgi:hypothetical protein
MSENSTSEKPLRRPEITSYQVGDELVLYDDRNQTAISLNYTAAAVWELCSGEFTVDTIIAMIDSMYGSDDEVIDSEILQTIDRFRSLDLLV